jgi:membrane protease YdiL (CAAX protease family)
MGATAIVLLVVAKLWLYFGNVTLLPIQFTVNGLILGLLLGVGITLMSSLVYRIWPAYGRSAEQYLKLVLTPLLLPDLIWLGLLPGLSEELVFRGVILSALGANTTALIISSLCFGILHFSGANQWPYVIWATVVGLTLGYVTILTGNLLIPIVAHIFTNFISGCLWKLKYIGVSS